MYPRNVPIEAQIPVSGHEEITTMGWYRRSAVWGYMIIPITFVALMLYTAVGYTLWHTIQERRGHKSFTRFDPSNPVHLMTASSARDPSDEKGDLGRCLTGFEPGGIGQNENLRVELKDVDEREYSKHDEREPERKRFRATTPPPAIGQA